MVGDDPDSASLLPLAQTSCLQRVVVKRPQSAPHLTASKPAFIIAGKAIRYDVYLKASA